MSPYQAPGLPQRAPRHERVAELDVLAWESALRLAAPNGQPLSADAVWVIAQRALSAPATAARCPLVRSALPPEVLSAVLALAAAEPVTAVAEPASQPPRSTEPAGPLTTGQAAAELRLTTHAVRAACRRGALAAARDRVTGQWRIGRAALDTYGRRQDAKVTR